MAEEYELQTGERIKIFVDDEEVIVRDASGKRIGKFSANLIEYDHGQYGVRLTHADIDQRYRGQGIGTRCAKLLADLHGKRLEVADYDGQQRSDGSHQNGDGVGFVEALVEKKIAYREFGQYDERPDADEW